MRPDAARFRWPVHPSAILPASRLYADVRPLTRVPLSDTDPPRRTRFHGRVALPQPTPGAHPGCTAEAEFRAPASNRVAGHIGGWQWLCLEHVRQFNAGYNF